jgi:hypothetical protein
MPGTGPRLGPRCRSGAGSQAPGTRYRVPDAGRNARLMLRSTRTWSMPDTGCTMQDTRYRMERCSPSLSCILHTRCAGFSKAGARYRVPGIGYRLSGTWDLVPGTGAGLTPTAGYRAPKTEPSYRVCILHPGSIPRCPAPGSSPYGHTAVLPYCPTAQLPSSRTRHGDPYPGDRRGSSDTRVSAALDGVVSASRRSKTHWSRT